VLKIFSYAFTSYSNLLLHCTSALQPSSIGFLKTDALQDVPFTVYVEIVSIILERPWVVAQSVWRETTDEKWKN